MLLAQSKITCNRFIFIIKLYINFNYWNFNYNFFFFKNYFKNFIFKFNNAFMQKQSLHIKKIKNQICFQTSPRCFKKKSKHLFLKKFFILTINLCFKTQTINIKFYLFFNTFKFFLLNYYIKTIKNLHSLFFIFSFKIKIFNLN